MDALGALISATLVLFLVRSNTAFFGMDPRICEVLGLIAALFFGYSLSCSFWAHNSVHGLKLLRVISLANTLYALALIGILLKEYNELSLWGLSYFSGEIGLLFFLSTQEWKYR